MNPHKLALITGGSKGLGKGIALELAKQNIDIILHYNSSEEEAKATSEELKNHGIQTYLVQANFAINKDIDSFFETKIAPILEKEDRKLDILINNAGVSEFSRLNSITSEGFDTFFSVNVKAPLILMKDSYKHMQTKGRIINISSTKAARPSEKMIVYGASKAALENVSMAMLKDFGRKQVTINTIAPGFIPTGVFNISKNDEMVKSFVLKNTAIKRMGTAYDIARVVCFLISDDAIWVNGQNIEISGGVLYN
ncbi:3-oxoacyl-[acyl-carrier-protein] reductase FabG [Kordia antarctica]|uniref:3-oxoacyl-[acyl-carrier-protein] reductase FabG n=1 Tax=Kordia antarctica TaxID=1218801 RepID=A0A7L4ZLT2_9FLAO|nr:SDR family oxidoreductase [Kordia antarctica]QHI36904.1 3-oxoacyl-[acyl-carrier-protein] reductase FabG [Kordia antarctica]